MKSQEKIQLPMLSVEEALARVLSATRPLPSVRAPLGGIAGRYLAEEIRASVDFPPFDRSAMDGYALRSADAGSVPVVLDVVCEIAAGHDPARPVGPGQAARIMTGAAIPRGADCVVMVENTRRLEEGAKVEILAPAESGRHVRKAGEDFRKGAVLLSPGTFLGAPEMALLASEGRSSVSVGGVPRVGVLSTGDELVPVDEKPTGGRIRDTNSWSLIALLARLGIPASKLGIAKDEPAALRASIRRGLEGDVLFVSGGVSMGEYDLVGEALREEGCRPVFQRVAIQPGKPLYFGMAGKRLVFGLPGNPASTLVDFLVFGRPALRIMMGGSGEEPARPMARLTGAIRRKPGRRGYLPARVEAGADGTLEAAPIPSRGSADLVSLSRANAFVIAPETDALLDVGSRVACIFLDDAERR